MILDDAHLLGDTTLYSLFWTWYRTIGFAIFLPVAWNFTLPKNDCKSVAANASRTFCGPRLPAR